MGSYMSKRCVFDIEKMVCKLIKHEFLGCLVQEIGLSNTYPTWSCTDWVLLEANI